MSTAPRPSRSALTASPEAFIDGFAPAVTVAAGLALVGAAAGLALPGRRALRPAAAVT